MSCAACAASSCASHNCALTFANAASACILSTALLQHDSTSSVHSCTSFAACSASSCAFATAPCKFSIECLAASLTESAASSAASDASLATSSAASDTSLATSSVPSCPTYIPDFKPFTASAISVAPCTIAFASRPKSVNLSANSSKSFVIDAPASSTQSGLLLQFSASSRIAAASAFASSSASPNRKAERALP